MSRPKPISGLPYRIRVYVNGQVLIPANVVRSLGIEWAKYASIIIRHNDRLVELKKVLLLRTRNTASSSSQYQGGVLGYSSVLGHLMRLRSSK